MGRTPRLPLAGLLLPWVLVAQGMEAVPLWGGRFLPGEPTEIRISFASPEGGTVLLGLAGAAGELEDEQWVEAARPITRTLPAYPGADGGLRVRLRTPAGEEVSLRLSLSPQPGRFPALVSGAGAAGADPAGAVQVSSRDLPRTTAGYGPIDALTLPAAALAALEPPQTAALAAYLSACGALVVPDADAELLAALRRSAGCRGAFVTQAPLSERAPALPPAERLAQALPELSGAKDLALLLLPYPLLLAGLMTLRRVGPWLLALPPVAVLVYALALPQASPAAVALTWSESWAGDAQQRSLTLVRTQGAGGEAAPVLVPAQTGLAMPGAGAGLVRLRADDTQALPRPRGLLSYSDYRIAGTGPVPFRLEASPGVGELIRVRNQGATPSPPGWVIRHGRAAPFPTLAPGSSHDLHIEAIADAPPPLAIPLPASGLLLPLSQSPLAKADPGIRGTGWLLVRLAEDLP